MSGLKKVARKGNLEVLHKEHAKYPLGSGEGSMQHFCKLPSKLSLQSPEREPGHIAHTVHSSCRSGLRRGGIKVVVPVSGEASPKLSKFRIRT